MERRAFGTAPFDVPCVGMGTWRTFDVRGAADERVRHQIVAEALDVGAHLFDSSPMYGEAERVLGEALRALRRRDESLVATKVWTDSPAEGRAQIQRALGYYGGRVDLYQIHNLVAWQHWLSYLEELKAQGSVRAVGATHYSAGAFPELLRIMDTGRLDAIQIPYNPLQREVEQEVLPRAAALNLGVVVMRPLGGGGLVRTAPPASELRPLERFGVTTWAQALLKWVLSDGRCQVAIPATSRPGRMAENAAAGAPPWLDGEARERVAALALRLG